MDSQPNAEPNPQVVAAPARSWFRENRASLILSLIGIALVVRFLHPLDVLLVVIGLGGIVFLHELGHFLAAKACDVHVKTFSVGFGPPLPFCSFQYGETFYKLALVPLGGYVAMVGQSEEGESAEEEQEGKEDPRSYKNKSVLQRMLIISAGVIMNIILGGICFIVAYMNGVEEQPAIVAGIEPGSAAWRAGVRPGERITKIDGMENPWFADLFPVVSGTHAGEQIELVTQKNDQTYTYNMEPVRAEGALFPQIGVAPPSSVTFFSMRRDATPPYDPGSAAALAKSTDGIGFLAGDRIVAMSDPKNPDQITPLDPEKVGLPTPNMEFQQRLIALAGKPVTVEVERKDVGKVQLKVPAVFRKETGMIMQMGPIVALRADSTAEKQGVKVRKQDGEKILEPGDTIIMVQLPEADGKSTIYSSDSKEAPKGPDATVKMLDPFLLPYQLNAWAESWNGKPSPVRTLKLTVSRLVDHTPKPVTLELVWDNSYREQLSYLSNPSTPVPLGGLGLAYQVIAAVQQVLPGSAAEQAGIKVGDKIKQVRVHNLTHTGEEKEGRYADVKEPHYWAYVDYRIQAQAPHTFDVKIDRGGEEVEAKLVATPSTSNPIAVPAEGFIFMKELQRQTASSVGEALQMGARRTMRAIKSTYLGLYSMVFGRTSVMLISGPITLARASYMLAGEDIWKLVLLVALISINLAVVNFLPIPVLDGGHMVFLIYEWIRRKPPPIFLHNALTLLGLGMVLLLMVFAVGLDIWRLIAQKF